MVLLGFVGAGSDLPLGESREGLMLLDRSFCFVVWDTYS
jgi:hypothetical protein